MKQILTQTLAGALLLGALATPDAGHAFGGALIDTGALQLKDTPGCEFRVFHSEAGNYPQTAEVKTLVPFSYSGGSIWDNGSRVTSEGFGTFSIITPSMIETNCDLTNVSISRNIGADLGGSYAGQDWMGLEFRATYGNGITVGDGKTYDYRIGLSGASNTILVNDRMEYIANDTTAPVLTVPADILQSTDQNAATAIVNFSVTATDNVDDTITPVITTSPTAGLTSGSAFPVGVTTVNVTATDAAQNSASTSFTVTVRDDQAPVLTAPADILQSTDQNAATAIVNFSVTATDNVDDTITPVITTLPTPNLTSGSAFPVGVTTVTATATDSNNNGITAIFTVTVTDDQAPVIETPTSLTAEAGPTGKANVAFSATVTDNYDPVVTPVFTLNGVEITSPEDFSVGPNTVLVNARDSAGNVAATKSFTISVSAGVAPDAPVINTSLINPDRSLTIGGTAEVNSTVRVTFPDNSFQEVTATGGTFTFDSLADMTGGTVRVIATDAAGNTSDPATVDLFPDYEAPTVAIYDAPTRVIDVTPFTVRIVFSENVIGFTQDDVTVTGGDVTAFAGSGLEYTAEITPIAAQALSISVGAGVAEDDFTNLNEASTVIDIVNDALTETELMITEAAQARNALMIRTQPRIIQFLLGGQQGSFNARVTQGAGNFDFTTSSGRPVWVAGQGQWATQGEMETSYFNMSAGAHFDLNENMLLGVMAQFDKSVSDEGDARLESTGWMVGPYAVARMADHPLVFSGSYLMGQSDNTISPFGTYEDTFSSDRSIATLGVAGEVALDSLTLIPLLDLAYAIDESEAYTDGDDNPVRATKVTTMQATLGLDFVMPIAISNGTLDLIGGIGATSAMNDNGVEKIETTRGQTDFGFRYGMENGGRVTARATYDGLGQDDYEAYGAEVIFEISF